jgi:hypothetical protein
MIKIAVLVRSICSAAVSGAERWHASAPAALLNAPCCARCVPRCPPSLAACHAHTHDARVHAQLYLSGYPTSLEDDLALLQSPQGPPPHSDERNALVVVSSRSVVYCCCCLAFAAVH